MFLTVPSQFIFFSPSSVLNASMPVLPILDPFPLEDISLLEFQPQCFKSWRTFFPEHSVKSGPRTGVRTQLADTILTTAQTRISRPEPAGRLVFLQCQNSSDQSLWFEGDGTGDCWYFPVSLQKKRERNKSISTRHSKRVFSM